MSPQARWILAAGMAVGLLVCISLFSPFAVLAMTFGSGYTCHIPEGLFGFFVYLPPIVMALGGLAGALLFGLNKHWLWWLGAILSGGGLGVMLYVIYFTLLGRVWCA